MTDDNAIIAQVLEGHTEAFRVLVERYQKPVLRMIGNMVYDRHQSEDIAQEVFLAAYRHLASFDRARSRFSSWLFTIARNRSLNALKARRLALADGDTMPTAVGDPETAAVEREYEAALDRALAALPQDQRAAFVMAEIEALSYEDIARIEGVRVGTVKSRINRARQKLWLALGSLCGVGG